MKRIIMHWTAGADGVNSVEKDAYHYIVERDGKVVLGDDPVSANIPPLQKGKYAAHTASLNSYSIGVAVDAMAGAKERPFNPGKFPITEIQLQAMARLVARLAAEYDIPVRRDTVLTHAEVERTLGVKQRNKWDIMWIPGMDKPGDPIVVGDEIRGMVLQAQRPVVPDVEPVEPTTPQLPTFFAQLWAILTGGRK